MRDHGRTIVISDTHLGRDRGSAGTPEDLRPLWSGAERLVVNGDVAELSDPRWRARAARMVCRLQDLCDADGVELVMLSGNHDPLLTDRRELDLAGGRVHLTHGDVLHPSISPWATHADELAYWNRRALSMLSRRARRRGSARLAAAQFAAARVAAAAGAAGTATGPAADRVGGGPSPAARTVAAGRTLAVTLWSWHTMPRRAAEYLIEHRPDARFLVFGHLHRPGVWRFGERVLVNTGGYGSPARPRAVVLEGDTLSVHAVIRTAHGHSLSARPAARFPVTPRPAATPPPAAAASSVGSADRGPEAAPAPAGRVVPTPRRRRAA